MDSCDGHRARGSVLKNRNHLATTIMDLSDDLITKISVYLNLYELAAMHMVSPRFNRILSWPDPSLRPYGSVTFDLDADRRFRLFPSLIDRYFLKRAAGFTRVCFKVWAANKEQQAEWAMLHKIFAVSLPQFAAVLAKHDVQLEIVILLGGRILFPDPDPFAGQQEEEELNESQQFSAEYWDLLSPVLTRLDLSIEGECYIDKMDWLSSMQKLEHLELRGLEVMDGLRPALYFPPKLSLPALEVLQLDRFSHIWGHCHLECPSLEALHLRDIQGLIMPTGLGSSSCLTTLDVAAAMDDAVPDAEANAGLLAAIESVQSTLEFLDISGWGLALNGVFELIRRLPRLQTLVAQRNGLTAVPALPATVKYLDLRANGFTDVPVQLESLTQLTSLALSSKEFSANFQIRRPLDGLISLPRLQQLTLLHDSNVCGPKYTIWNARSLSYIGLAKYEIAKRKSSLSLTF